MLYLDLYCASVSKICPKPERGYILDLAMLKIFSVYINSHHFLALCYLAFIGRLYLGIAGEICIKK